MEAIFAAAAGPVSPPSLRQTTAYPPPAPDARRSRTSSLRRSGSIPSLLSESSMISLNMGASPVPSSVSLKALIFRVSLSVTTWSTAYPRPVLCLWWHHPLVLTLLRPVLSIRYISVLPPSPTTIDPPVVIPVSRLLNLLHNVVWSGAFSAPSSPFPAPSTLRYDHWAMTRMQCSTRNALSGCLYGRPTLPSLAAASSALRCSSDGMVNAASPIATYRASFSADVSLRRTLLAAGALPPVLVMPLPCA